MPWVLRESHSRRERRRRAIRNWLYDNSPGVTACALGVASAVATLTGLRVLGLI